VGKQYVAGQTSAAWAMDTRVVVVIVVEAGIWMTVKLETKHLACRCSGTTLDDIYRCVYTSFNNTIVNWTNQRSFF
jgi:hypothetical protein